MCIRDSTTIDAEIRALIDNNYDRAEKLLTDNMDILHAMADALLKYETIDQGQVDRLMAREEPGPPADWGGDDSAGNRPKKPEAPDAKSDDEALGDDEDPADDPTPSLH